MKIHLVFPAHFVELKEALIEMGHEIVGWDYTLEQFSIFSSQGLTDAEVALIDGTAGVVNKQDALDSLKEIRRNFPTLRLVLQLPETAKHDVTWFQKMIGLAIYDIHFMNEFDDQDVQRWLLNPMTFADHQQMDTKRIEGQVEGSTPQYKEKETVESSDSPSLVSRIFKPKSQQPELDKGQPSGNPFRSFGKITSSKQEGEIPIIVRERSEPKLAIVSRPETITIFSGKGGVGKTTIVIYLAELFKRQGIKTGVLDLGFPYGHISTYLNIPPSPYAQEVLKGSFYFSEADWYQYTVDHKGILYYLPPNQWPATFRYDEGAMDKLFRNMQRFATVVLADMSAQHDLGAQLMAFSQSTKIYWVLDMNRATIFHTKRQLIQMKEHGFLDLNKIQFILNRVVDKSLDIGLIEETLQSRIVARLAESPEVSRIMNQGGVPLNSVFMEELEQLVGSYHKGIGSRFTRLIKGWSVTRGKV